MGMRAKAMRNAMRQVLKGIRGHDGLVRGWQVIRLKAR